MPQRFTAGFRMSSYMFVAYVVGIMLYSGMLYLYFPQDAIFLYGFALLLLLALPSIYFYRKLLLEGRREIFERFTRDSLTGLANRTSLIRDITEKRPHALILVNIDSFKEINDFCGHKLGDKVLAETGRRLSFFISRSDPSVRFSLQLYKLHADEFAILVCDEQPYERLQEVAKTALQYVSHGTIALTHYNIAVTATAGIYVDDDSKTQERYFLNCANIALKQAKEQRKPYLFYDKTMHIEKKYEQNLLWIKKIEAALREDRIKPYYQPILNNKTGEIEKYESLVRLIDEYGFAATPAQFLDVAKRSRLYKKITERVIRKTFEVFRQEETSVCVNISMIDVEDEDLVKLIIDELDSGGIGERVSFEILESEQIQSYEQLYSFVERVKRYGARISIDDFGSGYSNFEHILKIKPDFIKIDGTLIKNIDKDDDAYKIVKAIVGFAHEIGAKTIAEFVHSREVFATVVSLGIDYSQGYYLSKPLSSPKLAKTLSCPQVFF